MDYEKAFYGEFHVLVRVGEDIFFQYNAVMRCAKEPTVVLGPRSSVLGLPTIIVRRAVCMCNVVSLYLTPSRAS